MPENQDLTSEDLFYVMFAAMVENALRSMSTKTKRYLSIGGQALMEIGFVIPPRQKIIIPDKASMSDKYSEEELDDSVRHMKEKHPHLMAVLRNYDSSAERLLSTGGLPVDTDLGNMGVKVKEALVVDQKEASLDKCIWASMEWKWRETTVLLGYDLSRSCPTKKPRNLYVALLARDYSGDLRWMRDEFFASLQDGWEYDEPNYDVLFLAGLTVHMYEVITRYDEARLPLPKLFINRKNGVQSIVSTQTWEEGNLGRRKFSDLALALRTKAEL
ncbi:hypothetical protein POX_c04129 [Penicillium oxalicum]|uniref:hypothetical protein n=1 Tax=Penicillium oxalicum TaxID=69781 RepID=UPI0020B71A8D|nr:hypothetical protein POX_c04129 [Penicillium oxalicum]KAI2791272.1 hypothetical protein POX_c04129 [Penicillium oxalicum]